MKKFELQIQNDTIAHFMNEDSNTPYHTSFDLLMRVIDKIENIDANQLNLDENINDEYCDEFTLNKNALVKFSCEHKFHTITVTEFAMHSNPIIYAEFDANDVFNKCVRNRTKTPSRIEDLYICIVKFLKWYYEKDI